MPARRIASTASPLSGAGITLGAVDYITKPYRPPIVLARVQIHLDLKCARDRLAEQNA